jgi:hypothetical protein
MPIVFPDYYIPELCLVKFKIMFNQLNIKLMKLHKTTSIVIQGMLMLGMLGACQNEDALAPQNGSAPREEQNARTAAAELKLVKDGLNNIQYIKSGRYTGRVSKVSGPYYYTTYSYVDGATTDTYTIVSKRYQKASNILEKEIHYLINNGRCTQSTDITNNYVLNYQYSGEFGRLDQISYVGNSTKVNFTYASGSGSAIGSDRLQKITYSNSNGAYKEVVFTYTIGMSPTKEAKYPLNHEHTDLDKYLPIFGKFSDVLVQQVIVSPLPYTNQSKPYYKYYYGLNNDGYAISQERQYYPLGYGFDAGKEANFTVQNYSTNWQGI